MAAWTRVADQHHWEDLLHNVIHSGWALPLSWSPPDTNWTLALDPTTRQLSLLSELPQLKQLVQAQQLYFLL